jgi:hypothetical protein
VGFHLECDGHDLRRVSHFEVELGLEGLFQAEDVTVLDVTAVFAQMRGDPIGAGLFGN